MLPSFMTRGSTARDTGVDSMSNTITPSRFICS
jgi:hypothetical protein